ncbi:MAG: discoidin domain-containing protein [Candidatus Latescibacteria bacterium]|nr:discoidin domain-containing protein [Candidatus Latescibacterota bacterium]
MDPTVFSRSQPVRAECHGAPVYGFGDTFIYGVSPDFQPGVQFQDGNTRPKTKIHPKKSWEIRENKMGATPPRMPRSPLMDEQPFLSIHLIDGDPETYWCSRGQIQPDVEPVWIRIDLACETRANAVVLVPRNDNVGWPEELTINVSQDAWHWETVYENLHAVPPATPTPQAFAFTPRPVKQVWIIGKRFPQRVDHFNRCFSLAEVQVIDDQGENVALASRGAGVTVSSTNYGYGDERLLHENLWAVHYDLGLKWVRIGYWDDVLNWHHVEREKGKYVIDPRADECVTETISNGVEIVLCLAYTNRLYAPDFPRKRPKTMWEFHDSLPHAPTESPELLEGYKNYVRFMVRHFRDRITYYELYNETDSYAYRPDRPLADGYREYCQLVREVVPIIRSEHPTAKIVLGSPGQLAQVFFDTCLEEGIGPLVDVLAWHPFYQADPETPAYRRYVADVQALKQRARAHGFQGTCMGTELTWSAPYPQAIPEERRPLVVSELLKAKYLARLMITHAWLDMPAFWNETWQDQLIDWDVGLFRNTFSADPLNPMQPQPAYYVLRTLSTVFEEAAPTDLAVEVRHTEKEVDVFSFTLPDGTLLVALWAAGTGGDQFPDIRADVVLPGLQCERAAGIDTLNGVEQELEVSIQGADTTLTGMLIKDYPVVLRLDNGRRSGVTP